MKNTQTFSTNKIIFLVVFVSAALMSSLFIFYHSQQQSAAIAPEIGVIFPAAREIKSFELVSDSAQPFTQKDFLGHWTLLFFGFTHCSSVCPTTLDLMNKVYGNLHKDYPRLQVVLISLDPMRDSVEALGKYMHSFNADFIGATGKIQEIRKLQSQLGIFSNKDESSGENYQLQHTSSILLINPKGQWAGVYKFGLTPTQLEDTFKKSVRMYR